MPMELHQAMLDGRFVHAHEHRGIHRVLLPLHGAGKLSAIGCGNCIYARMRVGLIAKARTRPEEIEIEVGQGETAAETWWRCERIGTLRKAPHLIYLRSNGARRSCIFTIVRNENKHAIISKHDIYSLEKFRETKVGNMIIASVSPGASDRNLELESFYTGCRPCKSTQCLSR